MVLASPDQQTIRAGNVSRLRPDQWRRTSSWQAYRVVIQFLALLKTYPAWFVATSTCIQVLARLRDVDV